MQTPLHLAVKLASLPSIQMLLEAGADPNLVDSGGLTCTHMAVQGRDIDCLEALLQWGKFPCDLNYRNFEGEDEDGDDAVKVFVCWLLNVPATG